MNFRAMLDRLPHSDIGDGRGSTFFRRWDMFRCRLFSIYLHEFYRSDSDRCLHDHPWPFATLILRGGYWEIVPDYWEWRFLGQRRPAATWSDPTPCGHKRVWRRVGYLGRYPARHAHRIEIEPGTRPISLVVVGRKVRPWGFWGPLGWIAWAKGQPNPICETEAVS